ncbi:hypothetical protein SAMN05661093_01774 [Kibdelosporangium aridum]|uniref:Uncharacterized protein n=1 Tax=Kibdelosporangium aridum TaxID=2030 RepID=A0A1W2BKV1_KIBAR|nr:hypothetical protein SAMN05661093_01774 [Kibdelosporangium aridum]
MALTGQQATPENPQSLSGVSSARRSDGDEPHFTLIPLAVFMLPMHLFLVPLDPIDPALAGYPAAAA